MVSTGSARHVLLQVARRIIASSSRNSTYRTVKISGASSVDALFEGRSTTNARRASWWRMNTGHALLDKIRSSHGSAGEPVIAATLPCDKAPIASSPEIRQQILVNLCSELRRVKSTADRKGALERIGFCR